jgi:hypothetical protein
MTRAFDAAIAKLSTLPADEQDKIAQWLLDVGSALVEPVAEALPAHDQRHDRHAKAWSGTGAMGTTGQPMSP